MPAMSALQIIDIDFVEIVLEDSAIDNTSSTSGICGGDLTEV
jgi:hypothetical protein